MNSTVSLSISILIFILILRGQFRGTQKPIKRSGTPLLLPILYISTSLFQLFDPKLHIQSVQVITALAIGIVVAIPLIMTTKFEVKADGTYFKRSKAVIVILIAIFAFRFVLMETITNMDASTLAFFFNLVTLSYIAVWRMVTFSKFRRVSQTLAT
ncbi:cytochrome c biogenesis protein CcdC [Paenibacillus sp. HWE-109]|uniref:CcdC protein domain-containing protein n=1 Tax=Paenibacillus sp. HWE-109 TaxID=1306526 RepID=UPI001EDD576B|nr:CcdC protein domain-containing protein [Paenibacillus sp. HWE-109]UKS29744.1 cytochrome c biogenesis protein CcdC [Paenibacillus sp. HWE-109]